MTEQPVINQTALEPLFALGKNRISIGYVPNAKENLLRQ